MAVVKFGHTWWGRKWLGALDKIDYSNRLPRGERYARNGSVKTIDIEGSAINAKVAGRRPQPYKTSFNLWKFTKKEKQKIINLVVNSPYYLSQLEARVLPPELYDDLTDLGIKIFPVSWKDLKMKCSCPDWAVPCKHLAAVVYIIANEIDKNPFLVFKLHDFDLLEEIHPEGVEEEEGILDITTFLAKEEKEYNYYREKLEYIDFSLIPDHGEAIEGLLTEFPLFYLKKDFKQIFTTASKRMSIAVKKHIRNLDFTEELPDVLFTTGEFRLLMGKNRYSGYLKRGKEKLVFSGDSPENLIEYLQKLSAGDLSLFPDILSYLVMVHSFVLKLIEKRSLIPEIYSSNKGSYLIRWIPALFNPLIKEIFENLLQAMPRVLVKLKGTALEDKEQLLFLVSFFAQYYLSLFGPVKDAESEPVLSLFFLGKEYTPSRFEDKENARTIHLWLGRFFIRPHHITPVIRLEELMKEFQFEIQVKDSREEDPRPVSLKRFLEKDDPEKLPVLRDLNLLSTYLPTVNTYLKQEDTVAVKKDTFVETWFRALPALQTLGVSTVLPKSLQESFIPRLTLSFTQKSGVNPDRVKSYTSLEEIMEFQWALSLGDEFVSPKDFLKLAEKYRKIVRYKDRYLILNEKELAKIRKQLEKEASLSSMDILRINLEGKYKDIPIETDKRLEKIFKGLFTPQKTSLPEGLHAVLRGYQEAGFQWLYHNYRIGLGSLIADDMGLGKTIQVLTLLLKLKEEGTLTAKKPAMIIVPASLMTNWDREIMKFAPSLTASIYHGPGRSLDEKAEVIISTYAVIAQDKELLKKKKWLVVVTDEAQNIKTPDASRTKAVKSLGGKIKIAMTGTPVENKLMDYWSVLDFIMKNLLGNKTHFKENYAIPIERFRDREALASFKKLTAPFILRRMKTDKSIISDLPEKIQLNIYTDLTSPQAALYEGLVNRVEELLEELEGIERSGVIFKLLSGLKQICDHPALYLKEGSRTANLSGKAQQLLDILKKILFSNEKALVFTQFAQMGHILQEIIREELGEEAPFFYGKLNRKQRDTMVNDFQNDKNCRIMIISLKAGGVGLNLTAANHVIHYDLWWNPAVENQATDRAFRIGQRKDVNVHRFITKGTFEEKINVMLEEKQELADLTVAQGEKWINSMSTKDLKALFKLER